MGDLINCSCYIHAVKIHSIGRLSPSEIEVAYAHQVDEIAALQASTRDA